MSQFLLMHENDVCGSMIIDDESGYIEAYKDHHNGKSPFLGNANEELIISTTSLAGGLFCGYKPLFPACL